MRGLVKGLPKTLAVCFALVAACGSDRRTGEDAGRGKGEAAVADEGRAKSKGRAWRPGGPIVKVEGGELLEPEDRVGEALRIGAIGDSITQGGRFDHRYPRMLQKLLQPSFPGSVVEPFAVPSETCEKLEERFDEEILSSRPPYDTVIIQCGTNDLHMGFGTGRVRRPIDTMVRLARQSGLRVILLTVGPLWGHAGWTEDKEVRRIALNEWILGRFDAIGVDTATPLSEGDPPQLRAEYLNVDFVHPNRDGLDEMAHAIFQTAFATGWRDIGPYFRYRDEE